ncbi:MULTISPECIES: DUF3124 domain-containing protein [unclassified Imperialibacter]|uniref:DUF3124 domain-containing protein n=1 Tax=unclassified Imperialibacter TaxID=2629706 RepID=UPI001257F8F7|nr:MULTISPECIES: DUF3124 domain-containing protein [unclassified Imperialibacter]CAD5289816.1 conserved hypothetical protein [Imperialibacter sp. 89]CAD5290086.1 conserved hypothetical protein [Imperialibacter sp. 75]VVT34531.1 conserved hypothetical protein [Imperialibacter sp. EC-SDR9]
MDDPKKQLLRIAGGFLLGYIFLVVITLYLAQMQEDISILSEGHIEENYVAPPDITLARGQKMYVPAYSSIPLSDNSRQNLSILLSIRNTDPTTSINITRVDYYDTRGQLVRHFTPRIVEAGPMETIEYFIPQNDESGGSGANFFVEWSAETAVFQPVVEALMYGKTAGRDHEFKSIGLVVKK